MIQRINETERILALLKGEGKVKTVVWSPEQQEEFNDQMAQVRRDYRHKSAMSEISASKTYFTA